MTCTTQMLFQFLSACRGNWRNTLFISYQDRSHSPGTLMAADRNGHPIFLDAAQFCNLTGERIDPQECRGQLSWDAFEDIFAQYLLWHLPSRESDARQLFVQPWSSES